MLFGTLGNGGNGCGGVKAPSLSTVIMEIITAAEIAATSSVKEISIERHVGNQTPRAHCEFLSNRSAEAPRIVTRFPIQWSRAGLYLPSRPVVRWCCGSLHFSRC